MIIEWLFQTNCPNKLFNLSEDFLSSPKIYSRYVSLYFYLQQCGINCTSCTSGMQKAWKLWKCISNSAKAVVSHCLGPPGMKFNIMAQASWFTKCMVETIGKLKAGIRVSGDRHRLGIKSLTCLQQGHRISLRILIIWVAAAKFSMPSCLGVLVERAQENGHATLTGGCQNMSRKTGTWRERYKVAFQEYEETDKSMLCADAFFFW